MNRPPVLLVPPVQALLWIILGYLLDRATAFQPCLPQPARYAGWALVLAGLALARWAMMRFHRAGTSEKPWLTPKAFVAAGPYRFTRNPMYTGMTLLLTGVAVIRGSAVMLIAPIGFMTTVTLTWIRFEESVLAKKFGKSYLNYRSRVSRWL